MSGSRGCGDKDGCCFEVMTIDGLVLEFVLRASDTRDCIGARDVCQDQASVLRRTFFWILHFDSFVATPPLSPTTTRASKAVYVTLKYTFFLRD